MRAGPPRGNHPCRWYFPSFSEGLSLRVDVDRVTILHTKFPFLFGGTFIEGKVPRLIAEPAREFPFLFGGTFIEGKVPRLIAEPAREFPFLFGGTFIEGKVPRLIAEPAREFPFLFGGTFIEGAAPCWSALLHWYFPSFSEGLSLRVRFAEHALTSQRRFPFLFGGAFIEAAQ